MKKLLFITLVSLSALAFCQAGKPVDPKAQAQADAAEKSRQEQRAKLDKSRNELIQNAERDGVAVRIKDIARFRGVRGNQLQGIGLIVGLAGTGDTKNTPFTATLLANVMKDKTLVDPAQLKAKNVAVVFVTAELPAFASPGNRIDITVQSAGDASSLQGGYLLRTPLYAATDERNAYAVAMGPVSIGGFLASSGGASVQKNHPTVGRMPELGFVERAVNTQLVFDGRMYLELNEADFTTATRIAQKLNETDASYMAVALDGGTIQLNMREGKSPVQQMSEVESLNVQSDTMASIVINEKTGAIVIGGNVRLGPAMVAKGSLTIRIEQELLVSQPQPFSQGQTVVATQPTVSASEDQAQVTLMGPATTVAHLARIFQALKISAADMIAILEALRAQGALKARIKLI